MGGLCVEVGGGRRVCFTICKKSLVSIGISTRHKRHKQLARLVELLFYMPRRPISKVLLWLLLLLLLLFFQIVQLRVSLVFHLTHKMFLLLLLNSSLQLQFALLFSCVRRVSVRQHTTQFVSVSVAAFTFCVPFSVWRCVLRSVHARFTFSTDCDRGRAARFVAFAALALSHSLSAALGSVRLGSLSFEHWAQADVAALTLPDFTLSLSLSDSCIALSCTVNNFEARQKFK